MKTATASSASYGTLGKDAATGMIIQNACLKMKRKRRIRMHKPEAMQCDVHKVIEIKNIFDSKDEDGRLYIKVDDGWIWCGMLAKDLYRDKEWNKILLRIKPLYLAFYGGWNITLRIKAWYKNQWHTVWDACNHFESFKKTKEMGEAYNTAALIYAKAIMECGKRHPKEWQKVADKIEKSKDYSGDKWYDKGQDLLLEAMHVFDKKVADKKFKETERRIGPSGFQAGWAFQHAYYNMHASGKKKAK